MPAPTGSCLLMLRAHSDRHAFALSLLQKKKDEFLHQFCYQLHFFFSFKSVLSLHTCHGAPTNTHTSNILSTRLFSRVSWHTVSYKKSVNPLSHSVFPHSLAISLPGQQPISPKTIHWLFGCFVFMEWGGGSHTHHASWLWQYFSL